METCPTLAEKMGVQTYDRREWELRFQTTPPASRGKVAFVEGGALTTAIQKQQAIDLAAFNRLDDLPTNRP